MNRAASQPFSEVSWVRFHLRVVYLYQRHRNRPRLNSCLAKFMPLYKTIICCKIVVFEKPYLFVVWRFIDNVGFRGYLLMLHWSKECSLTDNHDERPYIYITGLEAQ